MPLTREEEIRAELIRLELCRRRLGWFTNYTFPGYIPGKHHQLIDEKLEAVEGYVKSGGKKGIGRLMVFCPPRHGKSQKVSIQFPAWFLGRNPDKRVIITSYGASLAEDLSRKVRNLIDSPEYQRVFGTLSVDGDVRVSPEARSVQSWDLHGHRGGLVAAGVGGAITGRGADILIIDDPVKDREEADSETMRQRVKDWYTSTAYTRLQVGGAVVVMLCMAGETPVLMADGTEKPLRKIKVGDSLATYADGRMGISKVMNWKNQGIDECFEIRMKSGISVKANERHPFLVDRNGKKAWIRLKNLRVGDNILRATGGNGEENHVRKTGVKGLQGARGIATRITASGAGRPAPGRRRLMLFPAVRLVCAIGMELVSRSTGQCAMLRAAAVRCVKTLRAKMSGRTGERSCASTTATKPGRFGGFCVTTVTSQSDTGKQKKSCLAPLDTYKFTLDTIESITPSGKEEVFDVQVERTENFIANGLVSHNTRWHEDDLAGWLLAEGRSKWDVLNLPAMAESGDVFRAEGEPLWPEGFPLEELLDRKQNLPPRDWNALYQQHPSADEGSVFQKDWFVYGDYPDRNDISYGIQVWDCAMTEKDTGDYSACVTLYVTRSGAFVADAFRARLSFPDLKQRMFDLYNHWNNYFRISRVYIENRVAGQSMLQALKKNGHLPIIPLEPDSKLGRSKLQRANSISGYVQSGRVIFRKGAPWLADFEHELTGFPQGKHDDFVDAFTYALIQVQGGGKPPRRTSLADFRPDPRDRLSAILGM